MFKRFRSQWFLTFLCIACAFLGLLACQQTSGHSSTPLNQVAAQPIDYSRNAPSSRDKFLWPFSSESIWNMPIGSDARYQAAGIKPAPRLRSDEEYFFKLNGSDPRRPVYAPGSWRKRCRGKKKFMKISLPVPDNLIIPDARQGKTPNNASAFLMPDGRTLVQLEPLARCEPGGSIYGWRYFPDVDIYEDGIGGAHFGSGLSSIGGSIRKGELVGDAPIRHALKLNLWGKKYLYYSKNIPGYRWPADRADKYAAKQYGGKNPELVQGTLLAITPDITVSSLGLKTQPAKKLFHAFQDYGAYVVDDAGWNTHAIPLENSALKEFRRTYGYSFNSSKGPFYEDMMRVLTSLSVVSNNTPETVGGGGEPRAPLAPPIRN
ncbi:hypothetical protein [Acaryochloris sp. IP29b_bin.148]|uniref:hypothetical protein n=1 Tax=Acaryochloris sp. IP29b_bin.148 TaxID=2969218 RepID=UPI002607F795|nr:hypothetical protein [Acaryochloris sp. IP29b_bin.148]